MPADACQHTTNLAAERRTDPQARQGWIRVLVALPYDPVCGAGAYAWSTRELLRENCGNYRYSENALWEAVEDDLDLLDANSEEQCRPAG